MRVLHAAASLAPRDGGPSTAALGINRELNELGLISVIVTTDADGAKGRLNRQTRTGLLQDGGAVIYCRRSHPYFLKNSWSQGRRMFRAGGQTDLVHVHGVYLANSIWAYLVGQVRGTAYVVQPHGTLEPYQQGFGRRKKRLFDRLIGGRILAGAAAVIAASSAEADNLRALLPAANVVTVPLGVTRRVPAIAADLLPQLENWLAVPPSQRVLFLGRLAQKKRPDLLIEAWNGTAHSHLGGGRLLIVGPAQDWNPATLRARLTTGRRPSVSFLDAVDAEAAAWLMTEAGVFALPSENENFGLSVAEAMTYGCAVVTTRQTAACEHVEAAGGGLVLPRPGAGLLHTALAELLADPARLATLSTRARSYAEAELTWRTTASKLSQTYAQLLMPARPKSSA